MSKSLLDQGQIIQQLYDESGNALRVEVVAGGSSTTSVAINDGTITTQKATVSAGGALKVDGSSVTQPISASSLPLPTGAATSANQTNKSQFTHITDGTDDVLVTAAGEMNVLASAQPGVDIGDVTINNAAGAAAVNIQDGGNSLTVDAINLDIRDLTSVSDSISAVQSGSWTVTATATDLDIRDLTSVSDSISAVQSGTWNINNVSGTVSLPTGASTSAAQTDGSQKSQIVDGSGNVIGSTSNALDVNIKSGITLNVNLDNADDDVLVYGFDGADNQKIKTDVDGNLQIDVLSSALPTGAATSANQTNKAQFTRITDGTDDALVTAAGELNVLATAQPGVDIGDVTINNASLVVTATNLDIRDLTSASDSVAAVQSGTWNINNVSGTVSLPTGASTLAEQQTQTTSLQLIDDAVATTGAAITAKGIAAAGTDGTNARILKTDAAGELQIDVVSSALPTGAATETTLSAINTKLPANLGQKTSANSLAVVVASDQSSLAVSATQSGTWNINNVSGTVSLPTGAATEATIASRLSGALVPTAYDEIALTYVTVGNGIGEIQTAVFKLATVTVKTLTLSYDGSNRLSNVVAS